MLVNMANLRKTQKIVLIISLAFMLLAILYPAEYDYERSWLWEQVESKRSAATKLVFYIPVPKKEYWYYFDVIFTASVLVDVLIILILTSTVLLIESIIFSKKKDA